uniref:NADH dehydrogenase subunit 2 n=1 Tax=Haplobothrium globuliforme TaxID=108250 RepID=A0A8F7CBM5_9CEST|nr:NADH dehydrogenase subunit 2 [Haplobothrium globuliforme]
MLFYTRCHADLVVFSVFFSVFFCGMCCVVSSLLGFWIFLELCGLSLIPSFFCHCDVTPTNFYSGLLCFIVVSGVSSVFLVSGILINDLYFFILLGFLLKFGLFPFIFWVYRVFSASNWVFIFLLSVVAKFPILFFCFLLQNGYVLFFYLDCGVTIFLCAALFWWLSHSWEYIWCHMSVTSVSTLLLACFSTDFFTCAFIYIYYFVWAFCSVFYFYVVGDAAGAKNYFWLYCFLLLITPVSMPLFYKLSVCLAILYSSLYLLLVWSVYSFSEQFFLYKLCSDSFYAGVFNDWLS